MFNRWKKQIESKGLGFDPSFCIDHESWLIIRGEIQRAKFRTVVEFGSGLSTWLIQTQAVRSHIALECSPMFFDAVIDSVFVQRAEVKLCELDQKKQYKDLSCFETESVDVIVVDGPIGEVGREGFLEYLTFNKNLMSKNFSIIIDDTHRQSELDLAESTVDILKKSGRPVNMHQQFIGSEKALTIIRG